MLDDAIVRWTARLFVGCYVARILIDAGRFDGARSQRMARWFWTIGCLICWIHLAVAFHFIMRWSHAAAHKHVLDRTQLATGIATGLGIYANYAFAWLWLMDVIFWWRNRAWTEYRSWYWIVQGIFAFLIIQATVVFGPRFWIPVSIVVMTTLVALRCRRVR